MYSWHNHQLRGFPNWSKTCPAYDCPLIDTMLTVAVSLFERRPCLPNFVPALEVLESLGWGAIGGVRGFPVAGGGSCTIDRGLLLLLGLIEVARPIVAVCMAEISVLEGIAKPLF